MLLKLLPEDVSRYWPILKKGVEASMPPTPGSKPDRVNKVLEGLISGKLQCWLSYRSDKPEIIDAMGITGIVDDPIDGSRNLMAYCFYGFVKLSDRFWIEAFAALNKFGLANRCFGLIGFTDHPKVVKMAKAYKGMVRDYVAVPFVQNLNTDGGTSDGRK
ncbi:MAG: hypothetical protein DRP09_17705 [Candidatus Thorarchaeota archaeon]|nr:MAG: hypothetical protein DRP09_17705 [Candidatus Thorarchaeota archaeon]